MGEWSRTKTLCLSGDEEELLLQDRYSMDKASIQQDFTTEFVTQHVATVSLSGHSKSLACWVTACR